MLRKIAVARVISPFVIGWVDTFRDAYARTGMNLLQSIAVCVVAAGREGWRWLSRPKLRP